MKHQFKVGDLVQDAFSDAQGILVEIYDREEGDFGWRTWPCRILWHKTGERIFASAGQTTTENLWSFYPILSLNKPVPSGV